MMQKRLLGTGCVLAGIAGCAACVSGQVTPTPEFQGEYVEPFNQAVSFQHCILPPVFNGQAELCTFNMTTGAPTNAAHTTGSWGFNCSINARSPSRLFGIGSAGGWAEFNFLTPIHRFGGYFGTNSTEALTNGGAKIQFFDVANVMIAEFPIPLTVCGTWEWYGWESTVPIGKIRTASNRPTGAHLMLDDLTADTQGGAPTCYPNCDGSTVEPILNIDDFTCFINEFAAAQFLPPEQQVTSYANCDESTVAPVLNIDDFTCFINSFAAGCS